MKVLVFAYRQQPLPRKYINGETTEITAEDILELFKQGYDVALMHTPRAPQIKKELARDGLSPEPTPLLAIDEGFHRFRQR